MLSPCSILLTLHCNALVCNAAAEEPNHGLIKARKLLSAKLEGPQGQPKPWAQPPKVNARTRSRTAIVAGLVLATAAVAASKLRR